MTSGKKAAILALAMFLFLGACTGKPPGVEPVQDFELSRYLGEWYEIARLDHSFEEGLSHVTATYSLAADGTVIVLNRGFDVEEQEYREARGKARFHAEESTGFLEVSFFGPFYGSYIIFELDPQYQHAFVAGPDFDYLWLLSRKPVVSEELFDQFESRARELGFDLSGLVRVEQKGVPGQ